MDMGFNPGTILIHGIIGEKLMDFCAELMMIANGLIKISIVRVLNLSSVQL